LRKLQKTIYTYGVGTCGPRQFYGTIDVHLKLEERIKNFLKAEDCLIFSYSLATASSTIPAFSGRGDILIVDKGVSISIQIGINLSRSEVLWFKHNDMEDLERMLKIVEQQDKVLNRKITRRYILFEGVYYNYGDIAPLPKIMELKERYHYRLIMDDSCGVGTIGKTGRGTCEHYGIDIKSIDIVTGSLSKSTSTVGGYCCSSRAVVFHQRLNSTGYVYSASLPPLLAAAAHTSLDILEEQPQIIRTLAKNTEFFFKGLSSIPGVVVTSTILSPIIHLQLARSFEDRLTTEQVLQNIVDESLAGGIFITRSKYCIDEKFTPPPTIRICMSASLSLDQLSKALEVIKGAVAKVIATLPNTPQLNEKSKVTKRVSSQKQ